ncbi:serine/threonine-protein kinase [Roseiconus lacunae]|uniref:serine/threonine protein kinase n=1 Tax=Roseiconus lacunae TaxID=2605694 RepID=UPI003084E7B9|nr:serine/threonine-protein kinase [Stieleria sp. HD01]
MPNDVQSKGDQMVKINGQTRPWTPGQCLDQQQLRAVLSGSVPKSEFDSAISHLDQCSDCRKAAETLELSVLDLSTKSVGNQVDEVDVFRNETACQIAIGKFNARPRRELHATPPVESLGTYRLLELVGSGGMGTVFRAEHQRLRRHCAIKLLPPDRVASPGWLDRFNREMTAVASLEHPGIVRATDAGHDSGWHYLVMEFLDGLDVGQVATRMGQLSVADACEIVRQAANALAHIHDCGLVHRDIKPSNLMLTRDGQVKLLDLGLVLDGDDPLVSDERLTTVGHVMGTMPYMAPEQLTDSRDVRPQSDLYSLGATLFRLIAGRPPHRCGKGLAAQVLEITGKDAPPLDAVREDIDREVVTLVAELLSRDPKKRPVTASLVAERLEGPSKGHQLKRLIQEARRRDEMGHPIRSGLWPSVSAAGKNARPPIVRRWLVGLAMAGFLLLAALVIKIQTDRGMLVVHSDLDGLTVAVKQNDQVVERLKIQSGDNQISLYKGSYQVVIEGGDQALKLSDEVVTIGRSAVREITVKALPSDQVAQVNENPTGKSISPQTIDVTAIPRDAAMMGSGDDLGMGASGRSMDSMDMMAGGMDEMMGADMMGMDMMMMGSTANVSGRASGVWIDGESLEHWIETIATTDNWEKLGQAMTTAIKGVDRLSEDNVLLDRVIAAIIERSRALGGLTQKSPPVISISTSTESDQASEYFMWYFNQVFGEPNLGVWNAHSADELLNGNSNSRAAIIVSLHRWHSNRSRGGGMEMGGYGGGYDSMMDMGMGMGDDGSRQRNEKFLKLRLLRGLIGLSHADAWQGMPPEEQAASARLARESAIYLSRGPAISLDSIPDLISVVEAVPEDERSKLEAELIQRSQRSQNSATKSADMGMGMGMGMDMGMDTDYGEMAGGMGMGMDMEDPPSSTSPRKSTYRGKSLRTWKQTLEVELDVDSLIEAMEAVEVLSRNQDASERFEAGRAIVHVARLYGGPISNGAGDPSARFMVRFPSLMQSFFPEYGFKLLLEELEKNNDKSITAMLWPTQAYLTSHFGDESLVQDHGETLNKILEHVLKYLRDREDAPFADLDSNLVETPILLSWILGQSLEDDPLIQKKAAEVIEDRVKDHQPGLFPAYEGIWGRPIVLAGLAAAQKSPDLMSERSLQFLVIQAVCPMAIASDIKLERMIGMAFELDPKLAVEATENRWHWQRPIEAFHASKARLLLSYYAQHCQPTQKAIEFVDDYDATIDLGEVAEKAIATIQSRMKE